MVDYALVRDSLRVNQPVDVNAFTTPYDGVDNVTDLDKGEVFVPQSGKTVSLLTSREPSEGRSVALKKSRWMQLVIAVNAAAAIVLIGCVWRRKFRRSG